MQATDVIANCVSEEGTLLVITRGREESDDEGKMPWPLVRAEVERFGRNGLSLIQFEDYVEAESPPMRRFRAEFRRSEVA